MKIKLTYPKIEKKIETKKKIFKIIKFVFLFTAFICPILNLIIGGKAWSLIVVWSLWIFWKQFIARDMVEYNLISQIVKVIFNSSILLILIDLSFGGVWAIEVVPIVCFGGITIVGTLLFADFEKQKHNIMPMLLLCVLCIVGAIVGLLLWKDETRWALAVMGAFAFVLLVAYISRFGVVFSKEYKKYISTE